MSNFLTNFQSYFSEEERSSELYRILATIGVNFEKTILEELNAEIRRATEISVFTENKLRSLLAFLLTPVRNVISASGFGRVLVNSIENSPGGQTFATVPSGSIIVGSNGKEYQIQNDLMLNLGCSTPFTFVQGREVTFEGKYSEFIAIPVNTDQVDLSYVRVVMFTGARWESIPLVPFFPEFPVDLRSVFPDLGSALIRYAEDIEEGASVWNPLLKNVEALWSSVQSSSVRPKSGFFPFFFNNTLFIKIFPGGTLGDSDYVPDPNGKDVMVFYRISDGTLGNLRENQLKSFTETITTADGGQLKVTLYNDETFGGVDVPSRAELTNLLRKRLFASTHVSSIPEYTAWFLAQSSIGDCLVVSDFERWRLSGEPSLSNFNLKGTVDVYLVDTLGNPIIPKQGSVYTSFIKSLNNELSSIKDISFINYYQPLVYWHFYIIQYRSVFSDVEFSSSVVEALSNLYSILWNRSNNLSLFRDLDVDYITNAIKGDFDVSGFHVVPYHYFEYSNSVFSNSFYAVSINTYSGEKPGGWYEYWERDSDGNLGFYDRDSNGMLSFDELGNITNGFTEGFPCAVYKEHSDVDGSCFIYRYRMTYSLDSRGAIEGWSWSDLWSDLFSSRVGDRSGGYMNIDLSNLAPGVLRCFWSLANGGVVSVGSLSNGDFGIRRLPSNQSLLDGLTFFGESVRFEKYK